MNAPVKNTRLFFVALLLVACVLSARAQKEAYTQKLHGYLKKGDSFAVVDDKYAYFDAATWAKVKQVQVQNLITFGLRFDTAANIPNQPFKAEIVVDIYYWQNDQKQDKPSEKKNISLRIEYDTVKGKPIRSYDVFELKDAHKIAVVIRKIRSNLFKDSLPPYFELRSDILVKRKYPFDGKVPVLTRPMIGSAKEKYNNKVSGITPMLQGRLLAPEAEENCDQPAALVTLIIPTPDPAAGGSSIASEYDIEYCFVDKQSTYGSIITANLSNSTLITSSLLDEIFRFNATRITYDAGYASMYSPEINLVYPEGYFLYRIRGVEYSNYDLRNEGDWWYHQSATPSNNDLNSFVIGPSGDAMPHEACLNWQYNGSFAEEGKRKEVVNYFDGKLQNRQTVTLSKIHASKSVDAATAIIQENILDEFGRAAVSILPSPSADNEFKYYRRFNLSAETEKPYSYKDILYDGNTCGIAAKPLFVPPTSTPSGEDGLGAGWYYSGYSVNSFSYAINHKYTPSAESSEGSFPFALTQYTPDQTGRIRVQGGVGTKFRVGERDTRYFYGKPSQSELDRLFGSEAGNASRYLKNMVIDPNGQISVTYINSTGKTVATALAGGVTANLDQLPSYFEPGPNDNVTTKLIKPSDFNFDAGSGTLVATSTFLAPVTGNYKVKFDRRNVKYFVYHSANLAEKLCYTCYYDIEVKVVSSCGVAITEPFVFTAEPDFDDNSHCSDIPAMIDDYDELVVPINDQTKLGEYHVTYTLKISEKAADVYTQDHWDNNPDLLRFKNFLDKFLEESDFLSCYTDCNSCQEVQLMGEEKFVNDLKSYIVRLVANRNDNNLVIDEGDMETRFTALYYAIISQCAAINCNYNPCDIRLQMIMEQVSPGGQYALYNETTYDIVGDASINVLYDKYAQMPPASSGFDQSSPIYPDPFDPNQSDMVMNDAGEMKQPNQLSREEFIKNFRPHWARTLAYWHPEYCYYRWCEMNGDSKMFDQQIQEMSAEEAMNASVPFFDPNDFDYILEVDPFFQPGGKGYLFKNAMAYELANYTAFKTNLAPSVKNILEFVHYSLYCVKDPSQSWTSCSVDPNCRKYEREWELYVGFYLQVKYRYDEMARRCWQPECTNCFIGDDGVPEFPIEEKCVSNLTPDAEWLGYLSNACDPCRIDPDYCDNQEPNTPNHCYDSECSSSIEDYATKTRVFPEYVNPCKIRELSCMEPANQALINSTNEKILLQFNETCEANAENLLQRLEERAECEINNWSSISRDQLKSELINVCMTGMIDLNPVGANGIIEILFTHGVSTNQNGGDWDVVLRNFGIDISKGCSKDLVGLPYPYHKRTFVLTNPITSEANPTICDQLNFLYDHRINELSVSAITETEFYEYLQELLKGDFLLSEEQFNDLLNTCSTNCVPPYLEYEIEIPAALSKDDGCKPCDQIQEVKALFDQKYPNVSTDDLLYEYLLQNFMNHELSFGLTASDYILFLESCLQSTEYKLLCDKSMAPKIPAAVNVCVKDKIDDAFSKALYEFYDYKERIDREFKDAYRTTCRYASASLTLEAPYQEYHYTLYYYDQAGNLVRTVPPEGVRLLSASAVNNMQHAWDDIASKPSIQTNTTINYGSLNLGVPYLVQSSFTIEMQVNRLSPGSSNHSIFASSPNRRKIETGGSDQYEELALRMPTGGSLQLKHVIIPDGANYKNINTVSFASSSLPTGWSHLALVYEPAAVNQYILYINGIPHTGANSTSTQSYSGIGGYYEDIVNTESRLNLNEGTTLGISTQFKEVRVYERALSVTEVGHNNINPGSPYNSNELSAHYPLNEGTGAVLHNIAGTTYEGYPTNSYAYEWISGSAFTATTHQFVTSYAYNSLNQVVKQNSPDGGTSEFWYDILGRLVVSQNEEQKASSVDDVSNRFSYTKYDKLGRIYEVGEKVAGEGQALEEMNEDVARNPQLLDSWILYGVNREITITRYTDLGTGPDNYPIPNISSPLIANIISQQFNLRNRVAATFYLKDDQQLEHDFASYYTYDISGNVSSLWQELVPMRAFDGSGIKRMDYNYDLISGKVNHVWYQKNKKDQYYYEYHYDAENRLTAAYSGRSGSTPQLRKDAAYFYYLHGPLARTELGHDGNDQGSLLQGVDYAYTLQGWMKGVNGSLLNPAKDMGGDGHTSGINSNWSKDVYSYVLNYFGGDYTGIDATSSSNSFLNYSFSTKAQQPVGRELFNGNIAAISLSLYQLHSGTTTGYSYGYDQLNRLTNMRKHWNDITNGQPVTTWGASPANNSLDGDKYKESYTYDANGNIQTLLRNGAGSADNKLQMDNLVYWYYYVDVNDDLQVYNKNNMPNPVGVKYFTNRLAYVEDYVRDQGADLKSKYYSVDIDDQADADNYTYDKIGNLIGDKAEGTGIATTGIRWNVYGKIKSIVKKRTYNGSTVKTTMDYYYDVSGNRVAKKVKNKFTFYIRDAAGNTMAVYEAVDEVQAYTWQEQHLYGSTRLGMFTPGDYIGYGTIDESAPQTADLFGKRTFELSNHLGNVHVTFCDLKRQIPNTTQFIPEILTTSDYYAFGMLMPERHGYKMNGGWASGGSQVNGNTIPQTLTIDSRSNYTPDKYIASQYIEFVEEYEDGPLMTEEYEAFIATGDNTTNGNPQGSGGLYNSYRYGFNGQEMDNEIQGEGNTYTAEFWEYDSRLGRRWNCDPVFREFISPYACFSNNPVLRIDVNGDSDTTVTEAGGGYSLTLNNEANTLEFYTSSQYVIKGTNTKAPVQAGQLRSITNALGKFSAKWTTNESGNPVLAGYKNDKNQTLDEAVKAMNEVLSSWKYKLYQFGSSLLNEREKNPLAYDLKLATNLFMLSATRAAEPIPYTRGYNPSLTLKEGFGVGSRVVVIGQTMTRVESTAALFPYSSTMNNVPNWVFQGTKDQVTSQLMFYNRVWYLNQLRSGKTIIDIGKDNTRIVRSIFHQMEQNMTRNYQKLHPN